MAIFTCISAIPPIRRPNKTLQGIYNQLVWDEKAQVRRRAMHEAVFEAGWKHQELMEEHRQKIGSIHRGIGREIIALDWTFSYHPYSEKIFAAKEAYDYVNRCWSCFQTVVTASISYCWLLQVKEFRRNRNFLFECPRWSD